MTSIAEVFATRPGIVDVTVVDGARCDPNAAPDLLIEVPHGATQTSDYDTLAAVLRSPLPASLVDFFHVNTDAGAPELALAVAERFAAGDPARRACVLRCRVPRTFIDCNRRIDASAEDFRAGKVTPGLMPWITDEADRALLRGMHERYVGSVRAAVDAVRARGGAMVMLHTYAPREVAVEVDAEIVRNLRRAYEPEVEPTWPLRPEVDVIGRGPDGARYAPEAVFDALRSAMGALGLGVADSETYPMHPSTQAWHHAMSWPGRTLCVEVRRDLLAAPFDPFAQMHIGGDKVARLAAPLTDAARVWFS